MKAGHLHPSVQNRFDLIFARNVFSAGGAATTKSKEQMKNANEGALDLVKLLSDNPHARLVMTEHWNQLMLDRRKISPHSSIVAWEKWPTDGKHSQPVIESLRDLGKRKTARVLKQAANLVVLRKKIKQDGQPD